MTKKLFVLWACFCMLFFCANTEAARLHELNFFQAQEVTERGRDIFRIEIGMNRGDLSYTTSSKRYLRHEIIVNLADTTPGKLKSETLGNSDFASRVTFTEGERRQTQVKVSLADNPSLEYQVYTMEKDRKSKKPYRLVIDIFRPKAKIKPKTPAAHGVEGHIIVLDAGHGGSDTGAVGSTGLTEKSVCLAVAQKTEAILKESGANVVMTRTGDYDVYGVNASDRQELQARVNVGKNAEGAEVFVSIHCNAFTNSSAHGMETYYYSASGEGRRLATLLNEELLAAGGLHNRGVKSANFYVMKYSSMPASLVELAFITNPNEERLLADENYQNKLAMAIAKAIGRFFG